MKLTALNASWFGFIALACGGIVASHAAETAKPLLLQSEFGAMRERLHMPPALPDEEAYFNEED